MGILRFIQRESTAFDLMQKVHCSKENQSMINKYSLILVVCGI